MKNQNLYELGLKAKCGDELSLIKIIEIKRKMILRYSNGDDDCYQYILERLIKGIKNYKF